MQKLNFTEIQAYQETLKDWSLKPDYIEKTITFGSHSQAFAFLTEVALLAEKVNHHPNWSGVYNHVTIRLSTHDINGVSIKDIDFAKAIELILA